MITRSEWEEIVKIARKLDYTNPNREFFQDISEETDLSFDQIKDLWENGDPDRGLPSIKEYMHLTPLTARSLRNEILEANNDERHTVLQKRAENHRIEEDTRAYTDALETRAQETEMITLGRKGAISLLKQTNDLISSQEAVTAKVSVMLQKLASKLADDNEENMTPGEQLELIDQLSTVLLKNTQCHKILVDGSRKIVEVERLLLGEPTEVTGTNASKMPKDKNELQERLKELQNSVNRFTQRNKVN